MAFDKPTRNRLAKFVSDARGVIADEFTEQFQSIYGISAKGEIAPLEKLNHLDESGLATATLLRERIDYLKKTHPDDKDGIKAAVARLAREQAFTILNRLAAIRMAEKRGLIVESVGQGYQSKGFKVFETVAGSTLGDTYHRYRRYLFCLFDELAIDLGVLFDRRSPQALLFPREPALLELLDLLHAADLEPLWAEDETIGWIYQYYNDPEERKKMRKESAAPRNSRELAVRNQFFTPRYVVEFLTDNTLGRIWYEMTKGQTCLAEQCSYLVRRTTEIFLAEGETAPETPEHEGLSQEELLKQPVHIPHRPLKDPREIRLLDPACGSMHFGLYAFDLFETIYEEAWDNRSCPALQEAYASKDEFIKDVPRLIIEHNIHGIDIDPRAVQIAGLSLWLRAQKAWQQQKVPASDRPRVRRSNIVCAEPMPGSPEMLEEFVATLDPPLLGELVKTVFDKMQLAGEAGSLLKIEEEIRTAIDEAKRAWEKLGASNRDLFSIEELNKTLRPGAQQELTGIEKSLISDHRSLGTDFWESAEQQVIDALRAYAEQADADSYQRRLFADDAARGFAFIDLCRKRYDVVVMNPPFGLECPATTDLFRDAFSEAYNDMFSCFVARGFSIAINGLLGAITSRAFLIRRRQSDFRHHWILPNISLLLDLGNNVMDDAMVQSCAFTLDHSFSSGLPAVFDWRKMSEMERASASLDQSRTLVFPVKRAAKVPFHRIAYSLPERVIDLFRSSEAFEPMAGTAKEGMKSFDNSRFLRLFWEVAPPMINFPSGWVRFAKGGEANPYRGALHLVLNRTNEGKVLDAVNQRINGSTAQVRQASRFWGLSGCTYSRRSKFFAARALPANSVFSDKGPAVLPSRVISAKLLLAFLNSIPVRAFVHFQANASDYLTGIIKTLPFPLLSSASKEILERLGSTLAHLKRSVDVFNETDPEFGGFGWSNSLLVTSNKNGEFILETASRFAAIESEISLMIAACYGLDGIDWAMDLLSCDTEDDDEVTESAPNLLFEMSAPTASETAANAVSLVVGTAFGRWDIRYATGERQPPVLPDPFDPLPVCPPGMLQNTEGLPAEPMDVPADYPMRISWPGILVDDGNHLNKDGKSDDIVARVEDALKVIWKDRWETIEQEACSILGVKSLSDYFRRPAAFFADHLKRYSKSRRQAPIYWPLSTKSGSYTLWLYYHRLTDQTLHTCLADFLNPKIRNVQFELDALTASGGGGTRVGELREFLDELHDLRDEIERVIKLPWKPNLNDGVLITASPLHKLFRLPEWQKDLKACWDKLAKGDYDWAHLAYTIWPTRVEKACETDRSIAIAHGREDLCKVEPPKPKKKRSKNAAAEIEMDLDD